LHFIPEKSTKVNRETGITTRKEMTMDKTTLKLKTRDHLTTLNSAIKNAIKARDSYRAQAAKLEKQRETYTADYLKAQAEKARAEYLNARAALWPNVSAELDALRATLGELHSSLDLSNPALVNAITLIRQAGKGLPGESIRQINSQFLNDQAALRLLAGVYKDAGLTYNGRLEEQLYDAESAVLAAAQYASAAFQNEGSLNTFSAQLAKIAGMEGHNDLADRLPDVQGWTESAFQGAGLKLNPDGTVESA